MWSLMLRDTGARIQWIQSFVTSDKITSIYIAPDALSISQQIAREGLPPTQIHEITETIDPTTAESPRIS